MASSIGYAGLIAPPDDEDFDLAPLVTRLEASPSWLAQWRDEMAHLCSTDAAVRCLDGMTARECGEYVEAYERDDRKVAELQRVARIGAAA